MEKAWRWILGMLYVVAVAVIWITASFVVQSVVSAGVSPFLVSYICNSLFVVYLPIVEGGRALRTWLARRPHGQRGSTSGAEKETAHLLAEPHGCSVGAETSRGSPNPNSVVEVDTTVDAPRAVSNREWSRREIAQVSLLICPFWFVAQFTFNLSLRYTTVTVSIFQQPFSAEFFSRV